MEALLDKNEIIRDLQRELLALQGLEKTPGKERIDIGLGILESAFPNRTFPTAAVHEFLSYSREDIAATNSFITAIIGRLMQNNAACLWISTNRTLYPAALKRFGVAAERIIFVDVAKDKDALWAIEEALKCNELAAVIGELKELDFTQSRRLQLAVEQSRVTGFIHRNNPRTENTVACVSRWKIKSLPSFLENEKPGIGFPRWQVQLQKIRNGKPGTWQLEWKNNNFLHIRRQDIFTLPQIAIHKTVSYG